MLLPKVPSWRPSAVLSYPDACMNPVWVSVCVQGNWLGETLPPLNYT